MASEPQTTNESRDGRTLPSKRLRVFAIGYISFLLIIAVATLFFGQRAQRNRQRALQEEITQNLVRKAQMVANRIDADHAHTIDVIASQEGQAAGARATVVDSNGTVVADSEIGIAFLADEGRRPEFVAALKGSTGVETRSRNRVTVLYVAVPVSGGAVRLAYPMSDLEMASNHLTHLTVVVCAFAALAGLVVSAIVSKTFRRKWRKTAIPPDCDG
jgi:two-component system phosphate regulon sensor histidine kinase PhoR